eukprot:2501537-Amphidinium_carterae.1
MFGSSRSHGPSKFKLQATQHQRQANNEEPTWANFIWNPQTLWHSEVTSTNCFDTCKYIAPESHAEPRNKSPLLGSCCQSTWGPCTQTESNKYAGVPQNSHIPLFAAIFKVQSQKRQCE